MGWSIGYDHNWKRDIGYGVPAYCDHPRCTVVIDRGLSYVCGVRSDGGEYGCGLYFCREHVVFHFFRAGVLAEVCKRCAGHKKPYKPKSEHPAWIEWKLTDESWLEWRVKNPLEVKKLHEHLKALKTKKGK